MFTDDPQNGSAGATTNELIRHGPSSAFKLSVSHERLTAGGGGSHHAPNVTGIVQRLEGARGGAGDDCDLFTIG